MKVRRCYCGQTGGLSRRDEATSTESPGKSCLQRLCVRSGADVVGGQVEEDSQAVPSLGDMRT
jgi:hypothetical protein